MADNENNGNENNGEVYGTINTPDLSANLKVQRRAIKDVKQARSIVRTLKEAARERNVKNARIVAKYNAERPYTQCELEAEGLGWKNNFTTKPLARLIDKVAPRFVKAIDTVKYLTNSALPENVPGNPEKTEAFRREITETIRSRPGWSSFVSEFSQENALFGFTTLAWADADHWFPKHFRQDQSFIPTGTKQAQGACQVVVLRESFLIHELFSLIEDKESAKDAGWDMKNTVSAINNAVPADRRSSYENWERQYQDLIRECNVGLSFEASPISVIVWHLYAVEVTGKVSHYIILDDSTPNTASPSKTTDESAMLFEREDQFDALKDAALFFTFQQGNGTIHGSKGIGREIYSMAAMLDKSRNEVVDRLNLAGKVIIQGDEKQLRKFKMSVVGNALLINNGFTIVNHKLDSGVDAFLALDGFLTGLLDEISGAVTPKVLEGERVTKAAVDLLAGREEESRDNIISRFLTQFAQLVSTIQIRLCSTDTIDKDAKDMQKRLLEVMTREDLNDLAKQPVAETIKDFTEIERQQIALAATEGRGNPLYNQRELERRKLTALISEEFAEAVLLPEEDPTELAEQTRLQQFELLIIAGQAAQVPISPRDNHMIHLQVMLPAMEAAAMSAANDPEGDDVLEAMLQHSEGHLELAKQAGAPKEEVSKIEAVLKAVRTSMEDLRTLAAQQSAIGAAPNGAPIASPGGAPTAQPAAPTPLL